MEEIDLQRDREKLERYQAGGLMGQLYVVQLHLEDIYKGEALALCKSCMKNKHLLGISVLASECFDVCRPEKLWQEVAEWAEEFRQNKINLQYMSKKNPKTLELRNQARSFRKQFERIVEGEILPESESQSQEHVR